MSKKRKQRRKVLWTKERRDKARERILKNRPWDKSTGPKTIDGKMRSAMNAYKGGINRLILAEYRVALHHQKKFLDHIRIASKMHLERDYALYDLLALKRAKLRNKMKIERGNDAKNELNNMDKK